MKKLFIALIILPFFALADANNDIDSINFKNGIIAARICHARGALLDSIFKVRQYIGTEHDNAAKEVINNAKQYIDSDTVNNAVLYSGDEKKFIDNDFNDCTKRALENGKYVK